LPRSEFRQPGYDRVGREEGLGGAGHGEAWGGGLLLTTKGTKNTKGTRGREPPRHEGTKESKKKRRKIRRVEPRNDTDETQIKAVVLSVFHLWLKMIYSIERVVLMDRLAVARVGKESVRRGEQRPWINVPSRG
jgi:hypothetical protein